MSAWNEPDLLNSTLKCNFCDQLKFDIIIIKILFIERHIQQAVRGALQHSKAALSVILNIQVNYFFKIMRTLISKNTIGPIPCCK